MLNSLRLREGFDVNLYTERTGLSITTIEAQLRIAEQKGLIARDYKNIHATELGRRFLNDLQELFLPD